MKRIVFHFDPISPFAYLAFEQLPQALEGCSYEVEYRPVLLAALLSHWGNVGPAEIASKRAWTYRQVHWLAQRQGVALEMPAVHPFNPLALLRLTLASAPDLRPNRRAVEAVLRHVWQGGGDANDPDRLAALRATLAPPLPTDASQVKQGLRSNTEAALAAGVFGVPSFEFAGRVFWGLDALPMLREALLGEPWFAGPAWEGAAAARPGITRR